MQVNKKVLLVLSMTLFVIVAAWGLVYHIKSSAEEQVQFLTSVYKNYLLTRALQGTSSAFPPELLYSTGAEALLATNAHLCQTLSRSDDICGFGAHGDIFLDAQEIHPKLTWEAAGFRLISFGKNMVDVHFNVYPEYGADYDRKIRYVLVKESGGWRIDDVLFFVSDDASTAPKSMRDEINAENQRILHNASEIADVFTWVRNYLREAEMLDRVSRFISFPLQICRGAENCQSLQQDDGQLLLTMLDLHHAYFNGDAHETKDFDRLLMRLRQERAVPGKITKIGALEFTFKDKAWWITKIDLNSLGA